MSCHEPLNSAKNVSDRISRELQKNFRMTCVFGILIEMFPVRHHLNLTRLPNYASVRLEIETFLKSKQTSSNHDATNIGSLNRQSVCVAIVDRKVIRRQVVPNVARVVARVMMARTGQVEQMHMAKERQRWQVASTHNSVDIAISVGNGDTQRRIVSLTSKSTIG